MIQHVAGTTEVSEPLAASLGQALELAGPGAAGGTVVSQDIVLTQLTGSLLQVTQCYAGAGADHPTSALP